jgi:hypothetical protein
VCNVGQHRQHLTSQLRGLDLHVLVQRRVALHLYDDRTARYVLFVLPGGPVGLSGNAQGAPAGLRQLEASGARNGREDTDRSRLDAAREKGGERRRVLPNPLERVSNAPPNGASRALARVRGATDTSAETDCARDLARDEIHLFSPFRLGWSSLRGAHRNDPSAPDMRGLTLRERQVLAYAKLGHPNKVIAYEFGLSLSTVTTHLARARTKLQSSLGAAVPSTARSDRPT